MAHHVFLSANQVDDAWLDALRRHLMPYVEQDVAPWDARDIPAGARRRDELEAALARAGVAVLLVSPYFLANEFAVGSELRGLLAPAIGRGVRVLWLLVSAAAYDVTELCEHQPLLDARRPLDSLSEAEQGQALVTICERIHAALCPGRTTGAPPLPPVQRIEEMFVEPPPVGLSDESLTQMRVSRAIRQRDQLRAQGTDTTAIDARILQHRQTIRRGQPLRAGDSLSDDQYVLVREIGAGAFTSVWLAQNRVDRGHVAIKVLHPPYVGDAERRERFFRGAHAMMKLQHPNFVRVLDPHGEEHGHLYFVMEWLEGVSLHQAVCSGEVTDERGVPAILSLGGALAAAHALGIFHRKVDPANILVDHALQPHLTDVDLLRARDPGDEAGPGEAMMMYRAPELLDAGTDVDARADVFSLGMTAIFVLFGRPLGREVARDAARAVDSLPYDAALREVLKKAVARRREQRYDSVAAFCRALAAAWESGRSSTPQSSEAAAALATEQPAADPPQVAAALTIDAAALAADALVLAAGAATSPAGVADPQVQAATAAVTAWTGSLLKRGLALLLGLAGIFVTRALHRFVLGPNDAPTAVVEVPPAPAVAQPLAPRVAENRGSVVAPAVHEVVGDIKDIEVVKAADVEQAPQKLANGARSAVPHEVPVSPRDRRGAVERSLDAALKDYARSCGAGDRSVVRGETLKVQVRLGGVTGKGSVASSKPLSAGMVACINARLDARAATRFAGAAIVKDVVLELRPAAGSVNPGAVRRPGGCNGPGPARRPPPRSTASLASTRTFDRGGGRRRPGGGVRRAGPSPPGLAAAVDVQDAGRVVRRGCAGAAAARRGDRDRAAGEGADRPRPTVGGAAECANDTHDGAAHPAAPVILLHRRRARRTARLRVRGRRVALPRVDELGRPTHRPAVARPPREAPGADLLAVIGPDRLLALRPRRRSRRDIRPQDRRPLDRAPVAPAPLLCLLVVACGQPATRGPAALASSVAADDTSASARLEDIRAQIDAMPAGQTSLDLWSSDRATTRVQTSGAPLTGPDGRDGGQGRGGRGVAAPP
jgi:hypothetical protein